MTNRTAYVLFALICFGTFVHANKERDSNPKSATRVDDLALKTETITDGVHVLLGKRAIGNVLVSIGADGTFIVDDQFEVSEPYIREAIRNLGGASPRFVINSHYHHDHAGGNAPFGGAGAIIAAHENARKLLQQGTAIPALNLVVPPAPQEALPVITFNNEMTLHLNDNRVRLLYMPKAHTESDIVTYLEQANVVHVGDIWNYTGNYPFIDSIYGGSLAGMIAAQQAIAGMINESTVIVPGHGPLANRRELIAYTDILVRIHDNLIAHARNGDSLDAVVAAKAASSVHEFAVGIVNESMWLSVVYPGIVESL